MERVRSNIIFVVILIITLILICLFMFNFRDKIFPDRVIAISEEDAWRKQYGYATEKEMEERYKNAEYTGNAPMVVNYDHGVVTGNFDKNTDIYVDSTEDDSAITATKDCLKRRGLKNFVIRAVSINLKKHNKPYEPISRLEVWYESKNDAINKLNDSCVCYYKDGEMFILPTYGRAYDDGRKLVEFKVTDCNTYCIVYFNTEEMEEVLNEEKD